MPTRSPAFLFYPGDWIRSTPITLMTPAEEGALIRLWCVAWESGNCSLPDDDKQLAVLSRMGPNWKRSGAKLRAEFRADGGRLYHDKLLAELQRQKHWREKSSAGGKRSAEKRRQGKGGSNGGSSVVEDCLQAKGNISLPPKGGIPPLKSDDFKRSWE